MGSITTSLLNSTGALEGYGRVFNTIQNNITNAHTPGYVRQDQTLTPAPGPAGGVSVGPLLSARSLYSEQAVRGAQQRFGAAQQKAGDLTQVQSLFDTTGKTAVPGALSKFFNAVTQWSVNPGHEVSRQAVLDSADEAAQAFRANASGIAEASARADSQTSAAVQQANDYIQQIADINRQVRAGSPTQTDPGLDAQAHAALEQLAAIIPFSAVKTQDGSFSLYLGGQKPLVVGDHTFPIAADFSGGPTVIRDEQGHDITPAFNGQTGQLGALIEEKNTTLPGYQADLSTLAQKFADSVNTTLGGGLDKNGNPPITNLFTYNATQGTAYTLNVNPLTTSDLAGAAVGAPGGNGNILALGGLAQQKLVNGSTLNDAYGNLGGKVGHDLAKAKLQQSTGEDMVNQARSQRDSISGVSLDEEAAKLIQFQQSYQAVAQFITVMRTLTDTIMGIAR